MMNQVITGDIPFPLCSCIMYRYMHTPRQRNLIKIMGFVSIAVIIHSSLYI